MNSVNTGVLNFSGKYINSKYSNPYTTNSILDNKTTSNSVPDELDRNNIQSLYDYSKDRIKDLHLYYTQFGQMPKWADKNTDLIIKKLGASDVNSSNIEMVLDLIKDKKLPIAALFNVTGHVSKNVEADLDKLFEAYMAGKDVKEVFVPKFKSIDEAANNIEIGDVCQIEGNKNISTKLPDGTIKELFISADTCLELFPPVERFIACQSTTVGDCYLVASLDSINQNPNARHKLLEMFRENPDGTVDVALGGFKFDDGQVIQKEPDNTIVKDISPKIHKEAGKNFASSTSEGIRAIEILHKKYRKEQTDIKVKEQYEYYGRLLDNLERGKHMDTSKVRSYLLRHVEELNKRLKETNSVVIANASSSSDIYTKDELEYFRSFFEAGEEMIDNTVNVYNKNFRISRKEILKRLLELDYKEDNLSKYTRLVLKRYLNELPEEYPDRKCSIAEILPKKILKNIFSNLEEGKFHYNTTRGKENVFRTLGLSETTDGSAQELKDKMFDKSPYKYVFTCSNSKIEPSPAGEVSAQRQHGYVLQPIDIEGERKFLLRNPHNTLNEGIFTYEKLCRHFTTIHCAAIE